MKKLFLIYVLLFLGACQSSQTISKPSYNPQFQQFEIQKITDNGIQNLSIIPSTQAWPDVQYGSSAPIKFDSKKLKIAIIGDTGCRLKEGKDGEVEHQNCADPKEWPYAAIAEKMAAEKYDFAIHTGDYHYREHCSDPVKCAKITNSVGDNWPTWYDDVFSPTMPLFKKSPLIFMRGNHEECARAGTGWSPLGVGKKSFADPCEDAETTVITQVGDVVFVNFDNSNFNEKKKMTEKQIELYLTELKKVRERLLQIRKNSKSKLEVWFLPHKPVYGYYPVRKNNQKPEQLSKNMSTLLDEAGLTKIIDYIVSGHVHNAQVNVSTSGPVQIVVGHGGTALDPFDLTDAPKDLISPTKNLNNFGYALLERKGFAKWKLEFKDQNAKTEMLCTLNGSKTECKGM